MTGMQAEPIKTGGIEVHAAGDYRNSRRRHVSSSRPRRNSLSDTDSNDEYTSMSETEPETRPQIQRSPRKRRDYDTRERHSRGRGSKPGPLSHLLQFLCCTIKTLIIFPLIDILGTVLFYILSTLFIIILGYCTLRSLPILFPKLLTFLLPRVSLPGALQQSIHGVSHFSTALGNTYCSVVGIGCSMGKQTDEEVIGNITYTATGQVRQASKVITSLNNLDETGSSLALDSVKIHSLGDATLYLSTLPSRDLVSNQLYKLSRGVKSMSRTTTRLQVRGKNAMDIIVGLYEQLATKLEGSRGPKGSRKYTVESVVEAKDALHTELEMILRELQGEIGKAIDESDEIIDIANRLGSLISSDQGTLQENKRSSPQQQQISSPPQPPQLHSLVINWVSVFTDQFPWSSLSRLQKENVRRDIQLMQNTLLATEQTKKRLLALSTHLVGFEEAVEGARRRNDKAVILGLDTEDLLGLYWDSLRGSRREIDVWD